MVAALAIWSALRRTSPDAVLTVQARLIRGGGGCVGAGRACCTATKTPAPEQGHEHDGDDDH